MTSWHLGHLSPLTLAEVSQMESSKSVQSFTAAWGNSYPRWRVRLFFSRTQFHIFPSNLGGGWGFQLLNWGSSVPVAWRYLHFSLRGQKGPRSFALNAWCWLWKAWFKGRSHSCEEHHPLPLRCQMLTLEEAVVWALPCLAQLLGFSNNRSGHLPPQQMKHCMLFKARGCTLLSSTGCFNFTSHLFLYYSTL